MCIATLIPANIEIPVEGLTNGAITNNDGHGWAVASRWGIEIGKSMKFSDSLKALSEARDRHGRDSIALFHSRWATHGTVDEFNVHPFYVGTDTVVAHNGVLPAEWWPSKEDKRSDTQILADRTLADYLSPETGVPSRRRGRELGKRIGSGNKLVFLSVLSGVPKARIINAHCGIHSGGVWYSNDGYLPYNTYYGDWRGWNSDEIVSVIGRRKGYSFDPFDDEEEREEQEELDTFVDGYSGRNYYDASCEVCGAMGFVNVDTDHCEMCLTCLVCWQESALCACRYSNGDPVSDYYDQMADGEELPSSSRALELWTPQEMND